MVWFCSFKDRAVLIERECIKHVTASKLYKNKLVIKKKTLWHLFYGWRSTVSRLESFQGGSLLFTTKLPEIIGIYSFY